ncbi:MAG: recombinase family protein [Dorea sp.]|nr:recombinase family protein [Dorea sp.]
MTVRAVIYARCSTEEESQKDALKKQVEEGRMCVRENGWLLTDIYVESRSGTTTKGRNEYKRLYEDLASDKFDIIVIKSQDRLMRNTKDWYLFIDRLLRGQKKLYIYIERKYYTTDDALITGIKAILAEEYSRELSKKINNAHRNRQKNNGPVILTSNTYGYRKLPDKSVEVVEEEAKIKRRMYELCAAGFGSRRISAILKKEGIVGRNGKPFSDSAILRMIHNPINKGTAVMNRLHYDFESKKIRKVPKEEQFIYENKVPPIVSEELWEAANREIEKRSEKAGRTESEKRGRYKGKSYLSGKLFCGLCKSPYYRRTRKRYRDGETIYEWKCSRYLEGETCGNVHLEEEALYGLLKHIYEKSYQPDREQIISDMTEMLESVLKETDYQTEFLREHEKEEKLLCQMNLLVEKLLEGVISDEVYQRKQKELEEEVLEIRKKIDRLGNKKEEGVIEKRFFCIEHVFETKNIFERAVAMAMMDEVEKIFIYPEYMEIVCELNCIKAEYGKLFNYRKKKKEERERIVDMMRENPQITARRIAEELGISLSGVNYRIRALKKEGRIQFRGSGGKGVWEILE